MVKKVQNFDDIVEQWPLIYTSTRFFNFVVRSSLILQFLCEVGEEFLTKIEQPTGETPQVNNMTMAQPRVSPKKS